MRKLKFRAWDKDASEYDYDPIITDGAIYESDAVPLNESFADNQYDFEQYIGLVDKNGKEIYEGDIVRGKNSDGVVEYSLYVEGICGFSGCGFTVRSACGDKLCFDIEKTGETDLEVIGNIHENPELLENKD